MSQFFSLIIGGALGTVARYGLSGVTYRVMGGDFPHGTLAVNLAGCFLIGFFVVLAESKLMLGPNARLLLMVGFCGAFTTFSTFILESANLIRDGETFRALINVLGSVILGFIFFRLGILLGDSL